MALIAWFLIIFTLLFVALFIYRNIKVHKQIDTPIREKSPLVNLSAISNSLIFGVVLSSTFNNEAYQIFGPLNLLKNEIFGSFLLILGLVIGFISSAQLKTSWRIGVVEGQRTDLIQEGLYAYSRNPYFLSYFIIFSGLFLIAPSMFLIVLIVFAAIIFHQLVLREEAYLESVQGRGYLDYCGKVNRYLPPIGTMMRKGQ